MATGYGVSVYIIYDDPAIFVPTLRGLIGTNPYGGCAEIVRKSWNFSAVTAQSPQVFYGNRAEPVRLPCGGCTEIR